MVKFRHKFGQKWVWASFQVIFSQTHLVTLLGLDKNEDNSPNLVALSAYNEDSVISCVSWRFQRQRTLCSIENCVWIDRWVARWFIFIPKIPIRVNFGGPRNGKCWYILWPYFTAIGYILCQFGIVCGNLVYFFPVLVSSEQEKSGNPDRSAQSCNTCRQLPDITYLR
jgi:hypothetical protein